MLRNLCSIISIFFYGSLFAQMAVHSDVYLGSEYELYNAFDLTSFYSGVVYIDRNGGVFSFSADASWDNSDNTKHLDGSIRKYSPNAFTFPSGHGGQYQPLHISQAAGNSYIDVTYVAIPHSENDLSLDLEAIHPNFYWSIGNASDQGRLTLSWNINNNIDAFLGLKALDRLSIAGLQNGEWQRIPSLIDANSLIDFSSSTLLSGSISSIAAFNLDNYSAFTLAVLEDGSAGTIKLTVSEGITPNNDGVNDNWIIKGIEAYPEAQVSVYNRSGELVFSALNGYSNSWSGNFKQNLEPLPVGPYFYTIDFDADGRIDQQGWIYINY